MKLWLVPLALLVVTPVFAQTAAPMVGDRPLVVVQPKAAAPAKSAKPQSIAARLQACLDIEDETKGRLDCYDAVIKPKPKTNPHGVKSVTDCGLVKDEEARLNCFNGFAERLPKPAAR